MVKKLISGFIGLIKECRKVLVDIVEFSTEGWDIGNQAKYTRMLSFWVSTAILGVILIIEAYAFFTGQLLAVVAASSPLTWSLMITTGAFGVSAIVYLLSLYWVDKEE